MSAEYLIPHKHTRKILCKLKQWVFFSEHSVYVIVIYHADPAAIK